MVATASEYEEKAVMLATNRVLLSQLRKKLETNRQRAPLFDTGRWVRNLEKGVAMVHQVFKDGVAGRAPKVNLL